MTCGAEYGIAREPTAKTPRTRARSGRARTSTPRRDPHDKAEDQPAEDDAFEDCSDCGWDERAPTFPFVDDEISEQDAGRDHSPHRDESDLGLAR